MGQSLSELLPGARERAEYAVALAEANGIHVTVTSVRRDRVEQARLRERYEQSLASGTFGQPGGVQYPANRPGDSPHEHGLAFDSVTAVPEDRNRWVRIRKFVGWRVPQNDPVHAEVPRWRELVARLHALGYAI